MKPFFSNAFGIARNANKQGRTVELQLDFCMQFMDGETKMTKDGPISASVRKRETLTSVLLTREGVVALIGLLRKTLGDEFDAYELCLQKPGAGPLYEYAQEHFPVHVSCPALNGIIKCVEVECHLALKKNASIEFIDD